MESSADGRLVRHPDLIAVRGRDRCVLIRPGVRLMTYRGRAAQVVEELVQVVATPASSEEILGRLPGVSATQLDGLAQRLIGRGLLLMEGGDPGPASPSQRFALGRVLVGACGAVQAARLPEYVGPLFYSPGTELEVAIPCRPLELTWKARPAARLIYGAAGPEQNLGMHRGWLT